jgi:hypothetical protein
MEKTATSTAALIGPLRSLFWFIFVYHLILLALQKMGLVKSK